MDKINLKYNPTVHNESDAALMISFAKHIEEYANVPEYQQFYLSQVERIKEIKGEQGYAVLDDDTIITDPHSSGWIGMFDGCTEAEARSGMYALMKGI